VSSLDSAAWTRFVEVTSTHAASDPPPVVARSIAASASTPILASQSPSVHFYTRSPRAGGFSSLVMTRADDTSPTRSPRAASPPLASSPPRAVSPPRAASPIPTLSKSFKRHAAENNENDDWSTVDAHRHDHSKDEPTVDAHREATMQSWLCNQSKASLSTRSHAMENWLCTQSSGTLSAQPQAAWEKPSESGAATMHETTSAESLSPRSAKDPALSKGLRWTTTGTLLGQLAEAQLENEQLNKQHTVDLAAAHRVQVAQRADWQREREAAAAKLASAKARAQSEETRLRKHLEMSEERIQVMLTQQERTEQARAEDQAAAENREAVLLGRLASQEQTHTADLTAMREQLRVAKDDIVRARDSHQVDKHALAGQIAEHREAHGRLLEEKRRFVKESDALVTQLKAFVEHETGRKVKDSASIVQQVKQLVAGRNLTIVSKESELPELRALIKQQKQRISYLTSVIKANREMQEKAIEVSSTAASGKGRTMLYWDQMNSPLRTSTMSWRGSEHSPPDEPSGDAEEA